MNYVSSRKLDEIRDHHVNGNNSDSERQILHDFCHMQSLEKKDLIKKSGVWGGNQWEVVEDKSGGNDQNTLHACMRSLQ
jgi:hypothetical protein